MKRFAVVLLACAGAVSVAQAPNQGALTENESTHMRAVVAEFRANQATFAELRSQAESLIAERNALIASIEKAHPGMHWVDDQSKASGHLEPIAAVKK